MANKNNKKINLKLYLWLRRVRKYLTLLVVSFVFFLLFYKGYFSVILDNIEHSYRHYISIINNNICSRLVINGIKYSNYNKIQGYVNSYCNNNIVTMEQLRNNILKDCWIKDLYIQKQFPNTLKVNIIEYNPFAILTKDNQQYELIDEYGNTINIPQEEIINFSYLLVVVGDNVKQEINNMFNLLSIYYNVTRELIKIERISDRRWNLILKGNIIVKMPEESNDNLFAWMILNKLINIHGITVDLEEIDLRIKGKIYLKYKEKTIKEIKNI